MRKFSSFMAAAVAMLAAVSCNKEINNIDPVTPGADAVVYTAYVDGAETKTYLGETTGEGISKQTAALWAANDAITIHNGETAYTFTTKDNATSAAKFEYDMQNGEYEAGEGVMAVYPGCTEADPAAKTVNAFIPYTQPSLENTYNPNAALAVAYADAKANNLNFKNATALLSFTIKGNNVKKLVFYGKNNEAIAGNVCISLKEDDNTIKSVEGLPTNHEDKVEPIKWAEIWADDSDWYFNEGVTYYLAVIPQVFENGFAVQLGIGEHTDLKVVKELNREYEIKANTILHLGELEYTEPVVHEWAIAGTFNEWNTTANPMTKDGDYYVLKGVTGLNFTQDGEKEDGVSSTGIKFVNNGTWRGGEGQVTAGTWAYVWGDGGNIFVDGATADAKYDIYLNPNEGDYGKFVIVPAGDGLPEVTTLKWGLVGNFNSWGETADFEMVESEGKYVARNFKLISAGNIKIRANEEWNDDYNYGLSSPGTITSGKYYDLIVGSGSKDMTLDPGSYDIWFDLNAKTVTIVAPGVDPLTATKGTPVAPLVNSWYLVGDFNNWTPADATYQLTAEGSWYVFRNFQIGSGKVKFVADANWNVNRGGSWPGTGKKISLNQGGADIAVAAGTYDVYLSSDASSAYFMTTGQVPSN